MKLKIVNNFVVLVLVLTVMMTVGCDANMSVKSGVNLADYNAIAIAKGDFECRVDAGLGVGTWHIKRDDKFGVFDVQNIPLYTKMDTQFGKGHKFPPDAVGIDLGDGWVTPLYPDGSLASDLVYLCSFTKRLECVIGGDGGCQVLEGGNFEIKNHE